MANAALPVVPIIDIAPYRTGGEADKDRVAAAVDRACRDTGFIVITGHGVAPALLARAFGACEAFFALPSADKRRTANATGTRGYQVLGGQGLAHSLGEETPPDLFEGFSLGQVDVPADAYHRAAAATFFEPNLWPPAPADFEPAIRAYYRAMADLAAILMRLFARARPAGGRLRRRPRPPHQSPAADPLSGAGDTAAAGPAARRRPFRLWQPDDRLPDGRAGRPAGPGQGRHVAGRAVRGGLVRHQPR